MDGPRFARNLEDGYRRAWVEWCGKVAGVVDGQSPTAVPELYERGIEHHRAGRFADAETLYREVIARRPDHGDAKYLLSVLAMQSDRLELARELLESATQLEPDKPAFRVNLGEVYRRRGKLGRATESFVRALAKKPDLAEAHFNLALALEDHGEFAAARDCFERALQLKPDSSQFQSRLAQTTAQAPPPRALPKGRESLCFLVAQTFLDCDQLEDAAKWYERAVDVTPKSAIAHNGLGVAREKQGLLDDAMASFRRAIDLDPRFGMARMNLAMALGNSGRVGEAITAAKRAIELSPNVHPYWHSNLIFDLPFAIDSDQASILSEARAWSARHVKAVTPNGSFDSHDRSPERRLRIGYVSPDFKNHCQSFFTIPLLAHHDHDQFEIYCYSSTDKTDDRTELLVSYADVWRPTFGVDDGSLERMIRNDRIDILVDLTMHMSLHRLLVFARKPAPVQISWLAYPGTTGLDAIDYRVTDPFLDPPEADSWPYAEQPLRLPETFWCYHPLTAGPDVSPLPALQTGVVTFGCLNHFKKVNQPTLELWAKVLLAVPASRMVLLVPAGSARDRVRGVFESAGVAADRIVFVDRRSRFEYLKSYLDIDVCLDTHPYNGHTTSLDAFWMGVPVVTLVGSTVVGRAGLCLAQNLDLSQIVASTPDHFVEIAVGLVNDLPALAELRRVLRGRMERSPLMDAPRFARNMEAAYRQAWRRWCQ
jgi:predicted O-linked N-acetylglucosamine transferase (SPINDLY family)